MFFHSCRRPTVSVVIKNWCDTCTEDVSRSLGLSVSKNER
jgi:hypothetical protein